MNDKTPDNDTSADDEADLRSLISALDDSVPRDGSWIRLSQYGGGPDEGQITGNRNGYRRLGIEFLKASVEPADDFGVDFEYLVSPDSTINFDYFELTNNRSAMKPTYGWIDRVMPIGCLTMFVVGAIIFVIGVGTVVQWVVELTA